MRKNKIIVYPLMVFLSLLNGVNYSNDIFQVLKKDSINHIQMDSDKIIRMLSGKLSPLSGELDASDVEKFCTTIEPYLSQNSFKEDFIYVKKQTSITGSKHFRYQQVYKGVTVLGRFLVVHSNIHHQISSLSNDYQLIKDIPINPQVSPETALYTAKKDMDSIILQRSIPELVIFTFKMSPRLAYKVELYTRFDSKTVFIDAVTGGIINTFSLIYFDGPILGSGENLLGEWVDSLYVYEGDNFPEVTGGLSTGNLFCEEYCWDYGDCDGQNYDDCVMSYEQGNCSDGYIEDCDGNCMIESMLLWDLDDGNCDDPEIEVDMNNVTTGIINMVNTDNSDREPIFTLSSYGNYYTDIFYINSETSVFDSNIASSSHASGVSSHDYHSKTLQYFDAFGYLGMSGTGLRLANLIDYGPGSQWGINNAFYNAGNQTLNYGMGSGDYRPWCAGLDVVAHEFGHSFTEHTSGLVYQDQPGALNEHMSDAFGYLVEAKYQNGGDWKMAEDVTINGDGIRNMQDPTIFGDPDHIESPYYFTGSADFGGVHTNSSVPNKVLYLVVIGDIHYGVEVEPFSMDALQSREIAGTIWFNWNAYYLAEFDNFFIAAGKMLQTATDIYPDNSSIHESVYDAWRSVGIDIFEPYLELNALTIIEENDGVINPGEEVSLGVTLENVTSNIAENVVGELSCTELEIVDGDIYFGEILSMSLSTEGDSLLTVQIPIDIVISDKECHINISLQNQNDDIYEYDFQL
ncbi:MAG: M4 family metallopeptidase, partial [Candidatus Neomarinimicrobiota bacterium]|nr:M4 family metallopeptidase [Candidatus Neomarinimicrobiota bacterium]